MRTEQDFRNQLAYARQEGRMEGRQEGRAEGREEGARQAELTAARKMLADGMDVKTVSKYFNLPADHLADLKIEG